MLLQTTKNIPPLTILVGEIFELSTIKEIPLDVFFSKRRQKLCFISFIKKELLTKFDEIHYTFTNGSEKPSLAVSNNSNVLPPQ